MANGHVHHSFVLCRPCEGGFFCGKDITSVSSQPGGMDTTARTDAAARRPSPLSAVWRVAVWVVAFPIALLILLLALLTGGIEAGVCGRLHDDSGD